MIKYSLMYITDMKSFPSDRPWAKNTPYSSTTVQNVFILRNAKKNRKRLKCITYELFCFKIINFQIKEALCYLTTYTCKPEV